jgi:hypothetical protein
MSLIFNLLSVLRNFEISKVENSAIAEVRKFRLFIPLIYGFNFWLLFQYGFFNRLEKL